MMLFKYSKVTDYFKTNLRERQIWFSAPVDFNDVDDSALRIDCRFTDEEVKNEFLFIQQQIYQTAFINKDFSDRPILMENEAELFYKSIFADRGPDGAPDYHGRLRDSVLAGLEQRRRNIGISCFSQDNTNRLLWSHYADGDRGVCMAVETSFDNHGFPQLEAVTYVDVLPQIKLLSYMGNNLVTLFTTKSREWAYEREIRAFQHKCGNYPMDPRCLLNIYFGERTPPDEIREIVEIVRNRYGKQVGLLRMVRAPDGGWEFQKIPN